MKSRFIDFQNTTYFFDSVFALVFLNKEMPFRSLYFFRSFAKKPSASFKISFALRSSAFSFSSSLFRFSSSLSLSLVFVVSAFLLFSMTTTFSTAVQVDLLPFLHLSHPIALMLLPWISLCTSFLSLSILSHNDTAQDILFRSLFFNYIRKICHHVDQ